MIYDESIIADGLKSAVASYYTALLIKLKSEDKAKIKVRELLDSVKEEYKTEMDISKSSNDSKPFQKPSKL